MGNLSSLSVAGVTNLYGVTRINDNTPAFATLIIKNKETVFKVVSGSAELENGKCVRKATLDTPFAICSLTKHFTTAAILMLEEEGVLSIDDGILQYIPQLPTDFTGIKIRHLIFHISGIPNYNEMPDVVDPDSKYYKDGAILNHGKILNLILQTKPSELSKSFAYSNSGYILLAEIIKNVSGLSFAHFLQQHIFDRFGMVNAFLIENIGKHYNYTHQYNSWPLFTPTGWIEKFHLSGDGGLFMSINDYEKWITAFDSGLIFKNQETMAKYLSTGKFDNNSNVYYRGLNYGFGMGHLEKQRKGSVYKTIEHTGGLPGSVSIFNKLSSITDDIWVVYFNNGGSFVDVFDILDQANINY